MLYKNQWYQVLDKTRVKRVTVFEYLNSDIAIKGVTQKLKYKAIEDDIALRPRVEIKRKVKHRFRKPVPRSSAYRLFRLAGSRPI